MSSRAADRPAGAAEAAGLREGGFMLLEVLVALVVAGLVLGAVAAALAQGWRNTRIPLDVLAAAALARNALDSGPEGPAPSLPGFAVSRHVAEIALVARPSPVAPAPRLLAPPTQGAGAGDRGPVALRGLVLSAAGSGQGHLQRRTVSIRTPTGRRIDMDTVTLDATTE